VLANAILWLRRADEGAGLARNCNLFAEVTRSQSLHKVRALYMNMDGSLTHPSLAARELVNNPRRLYT
jgi:hypothetical protein